MFYLAHPEVRGWLRPCWFLTRPFGEIHVYFLLGCCWKIVFVMVSLFVRQKATISILPLSFLLPKPCEPVALVFIFMLHPFTDFCNEVACYHDEVSLWDAIKSVLELVVKILKIIIRGCGGWCIDLNDWEVNWPALGFWWRWSCRWLGCNLRHA